MPVESYRGTSVERFVEQSRAAFRTPMGESRYADHVAALNSRMQSEVGSQIDANRPQIVGLFPWAVRAVISAAWSCMVRIGEFIAEALVSVVLLYLAEMTIEEIAELIVKYKQKKANGNPYPVGVVPPK